MTTSANTTDKEKQLGKYTIVEFLGKGGMAEVYKAKLKGIGGFEKVLVIKKILPHLASSESFIKMFFDEAKITVALHHPNIVQVFELGEIEGTYYMSMEYVDGCNLNKLIGKVMAQKARLPFKHLIFIVMEVCKALYYAHRAVDSNGEPLNIIHRDVTHSNILISYSGDVKLADFGIAKARIQEGKEKPGVIKGKLGYMAPELIKGEEIDSRADIYSLGVVFFEAMTLKKLFKGGRDEEVVRKILNHDVDTTLMDYPTIPDEVQDILRRALAVDREKRYHSAHEFFTDLNDYIFNNGIQVSPHEFSEFVCKIMKGRDSIIAPDEGSSISSPKTGMSEIFKMETSTKEISYDETLMEQKKLDRSIAEAITGSRKLVMPDIEGKPQYEGEVKKYLLPRLICRIYLGELSGKLKVISDGAKRQIYFRKGEITGVFSNLPEEDFQKYLIETTTVDFEEMEKASREADGDFIGITLFEREKISAAELKKCTLAAYRERIGNMITAEEGKYEFYKGQFSFPPLHNSINPLSLVTAAIRKNFTESMLVKALDKYFGRRIMLSKKSRVKIEDIALSREEIASIKLISSGEIFEEILERAKADSLKRLIILRTVYILYQYELLKFVKEQLLKR